MLRAAALPVEIARLRGELRGRLEEVEESRARIVRAGYEERRRLERDLHDGAQQRLRGPRAWRCGACSAASPATRRRPRALDDAVDGVAEAVRDLREIARGLRPGDARRRAGPGAGRPGAPHAARGRRRRPGRDGCPPEIETAAYYVVSEALANAVKHAERDRG